MSSPTRGFPGEVLAAFGAEDFRLTVTDRCVVSDHYLRLRFVGGGLLAGRELYPTMWIRMWFPDVRAGAPDVLHQRGFAVVDPDPDADTFAVEFALHDGVAARWARTAQPGDTIAATILATKFAVPQPAPRGYLIVGDIASLPAVNSLLATITDRPALVWLEWVHDDDRLLPVTAHPRCEIAWVRREDGGRSLAAAVRSAAFDAADHFCFVACDDRTTRAVAAILRERYRVPRRSMKCQGYWAA